MERNKHFQGRHQTDFQRNYSPTKGSKKNSRTSSQKIDHENQTKNQKNLKIKKLIMRENGQYSIESTRLDGSFLSARLSVTDLDGSILPQKLKEASHDPSDSKNQNILTKLKNHETAFSKKQTKPFYKREASLLSTNFDKVREGRKEGEEKEKSPKPKSSCLVKKDSRHSSGKKRSQSRKLRVRFADTEKDSGGRRGGDGKREERKPLKYKENSPKTGSGADELRKKINNIFIRYVLDSIR